MCVCVCVQGGDATGAELHDGVAQSPGDLVQPDGHVCDAGVPQCRQVSVLHQREDPQMRCALSAFGPTRQLARVPYDVLFLEEELEEIPDLLNHT